MVKTPYTKPSRPLIRILYNPYIPPIQGVLALAHIRLAEGGYEVAKGLYEVQSGSPAFLENLGVSCAAMKTH